MKSSDLRKIVREEIESVMGEKFSAIATEVNAMEYIAAYPDINGIETRDGLERWEMKDRANRELYFVKDKKEAEETIKEFERFK